MRKGSITVFLALLLSILTTLTTAFLLSIKLAVAKVQIISALDIGLYSLFAQYDRDLQQEFDLFFLDGAFDGEELRMDVVCDIIKEYMEPVLEQNFTDLQLEASGLTSYSLATDHGGEAFCRQAIQVEKEFLAKQRMPLSIGEVRRQVEQIRRQEEQQANWNIEETFLAYDRQIIRDKVERGESEEREIVDGFSNETLISLKNPIEVVRHMAQRELTEILLVNPIGVSNKGVNSHILLSQREQEKGFLSFAQKEMGEEEELVLQEYFLEKCSNYLNPGDGQLTYQWEYLLGGRDTDRENLECVLRRLLTIREGINRTYIYGDSIKRAEAAAMAVQLAGSANSAVLEEVLLDCWAFGESVIEVRCLLKGGKVAPVKNAQNWQLPLGHLAFFPEELDSFSKDRQQGMQYRDYIRALLFMEGKEMKVQRGMNMIEVSMRAKPGRESFRLDACIACAEVAADVDIGGVKTITAVHGYTYNEEEP